MSAFSKIFCLISMYYAKIEEPYYRDCTLQPRVALLIGSNFKLIHLTVSLQKFFPNQLKHRARRINRYGWRCNGTNRSLLVAGTCVLLEL